MKQFNHDKELASIFLFMLMLVAIAFVAHKVTSKEKPFLTFKLILNGEQLIDFQLGGSK
jgi:hypothetical protein